MKFQRLRSCLGLFRRPASLCGALGLVFAAALPAPTQNAIANGDTRTIHLHHAHTGESIAATFRVDGQYDRATLDKLNWFLRDWRTDEPTKMNPRLFDVIWETYRESGSRQPVQIVSAYRSPATNAMLRRRSRAVAEHSQHMLGKALDMHYLDVPMSKVREIAMRLQRGGVGYYPTAGTPFVHLDVGSVRAWPRMNYDQLARLFPDGKTVHLPTNGQPLARYDEARAEIEARGDAPVMLASAAAAGSSRGFFSRLFGIGEDDEDTGAIQPVRSGRTRLARATTVDKDDAGSIDTPSQRRGAETLARAERNLPKGETTMGVPTPPVIPVQVASIAVTPPTFAPTNFPLPPRRPAELGAAPVVAPAAVVAYADVPLPPVRPAALVTLASANLPDVIRQGAEPALGVMAYAAPAVAALAIEEANRPALRGALPVRAAAPALAQPVGLRANAVVRKPQLVAARLDRTNFALMTQPTALAATMSQSQLGAMTGLRAAARNDARSWAMSGQVQGATEFGAVVSELSSKGFSGPAVRPVQVSSLTGGMATLASQ